jgi:hypothetical protein
MIDNKEELIKKFESYVDKDPITECWNWKGYIHPCGMGTFYYKGKNRVAHIIAYIIYIEDIEINTKERVVIQTCKNRLCVNPKHLIISPTVSYTLTMLKRGDISEDDRRWLANDFISHVEVKGNNECWPFTGFKARGYGKYGKNGETLAHRVAYRLFVGPISQDMCVCHTCDNPSCCNYRHLFLGTYDDNNKDRAKKGRNAIGNRSGRYTHPECTARGENNGSAKADEEMVRWIRANYIAGSRKYGLRSIADLLGIGKETVRSIVNGTSWTHIK